MTSPPPPTRLSSRLTSLAGQLGLGGKTAKRILDRARQISLPFQPVPLPTLSIWWQLGPQLERLVDLPRGALSGPVQEDKAAAHAVLARLVEMQHSQAPSFDLRDIFGLCCPPVDQHAHSRLEDLAATPTCRSLRLISFKDFLKRAEQTLPREQPVRLHRAEWFGERLFYVGENGATVAALVAYARLRGLQYQVPAEIVHYRLNPVVLAELHSHYHMLGMPVETWSDPAFMGLLLDSGLPYSRLLLQRTPTILEALLLPRDDEQANALGEGLRLAGAPDLVEYLYNLPTTLQIDL